eukprot:514963_1
MQQFIPPLEPMQSNITKDVMRPQDDADKQEISRKLATLQMVNKEMMEHVVDVLMNDWMPFMKNLFYVGHRRRASVPMTQNFIKAAAIPHFKAEYGIKNWRETPKLKHIKSNILSVEQMSKLFTPEAVRNKYTTDTAIIAAEPRFIWKDGHLDIEADIMSLNLVTGLSNGDPIEKRKRKKRQRSLRIEQKKQNRKLVCGFIRHENSTSYEIPEMIYRLISSSYFSINLPPNFSYGK